jgi:hypothetical protein
MGHPRQGEHDALLSCGDHVHTRRYTTGQDVAAEDCERHEVFREPRGSGLGKWPLVSKTTARYEAALSVIVGRGLLRCVTGAVEREKL